MKAPLIIVLALMPICAVLGAPVSPPTDLKSFLGILTGIINILIPLIFAMTFLTIAWGVVKKWIMGEASSDDIESGKKIALAGIIALVIMISIWGILNVLQDSIFGL